MTVSKHADETAALLHMRLGERRSEIDLQSDESSCLGRERLCLERHRRFLRMCNELVEKTGTTVARKHGRPSTTTGQHGAARGEIELPLPCRIRVTNQAVLIQYRPDLLCEQSDPHRS